MKNRFSLKEYSLLASAIAIKSVAHSEVIYLDIPDVVIDESYEEYHMDIDDNGSEDFRFIKFSGSYIWSTSSGITELRFFHDVRVDLFNSTSVFEYNQIAGIGFSTYFSYMNYWPYALLSGALVNDELQFQDGFVQHMASRIDIGNGTSWVHDKDAGYWWPSMEDRYLGVHFVDSESNYHYGWIRCSVLDSAEVLIIKDFAYETEIDHPIVAGDTTHYVGINNIENTLDATVYGFGKDIYILTETYQKTEVIICNLNGQEVVRNFLQSENELINMSNYPAGIYLVTLLNCGKRYDKKIFIE